MYNEERKEAFIKSYTSSPRSAYYVRAIFKKFGTYEDNIWHEDVCLQPTEVIEPIINSKTGTRMESAERALIVLKDYVKWCGRNSIKTSNGVFNVRVDVVEAVKNQMVSSPLQLRNKLDELFEDIENETIACLYKAYLWMAYAGLSDVEALEVTVDEIDLSELVIRHNNKIYQLYKESKRTFENACTLKEFKYSHDSYSNDIFKTRVPGNKVMRGFKSGGMKLSTLRSVITHKSVDKGMKISYKKIYYSGVFFRAYEKERAGIEVTFKDYVAEQIAENNYSTSRNRTINKIANQLMRSLEVDYDRWKCAFNV